MKLSEKVREQMIDEYYQRLEAEQRINEMKCCASCRYFYSSDTCTRKTSLAETTNYDYCDEWEVYK